MLNSQSIRDIKPGEESYNAMNDSKENRLNFIFLTLWLLFTFGIALFSWRFAGVDFRGYYAAAKVFLAGGNPYDYHLVAQVLLETTGKIGNNPFYYLPWFLIFIAPLSFFSFSVARLIWLFVNAVMWISGLIILWRYVGEDWRPWKKYLLGIFLNITFLWITLRYEQTGVLLFFLTTLVIQYLSTNRDRLVGVLLVLLLIKPTVSALVVIALLIWGIKGRRLGILKAFAISLSLFLILFTILVPEWYMTFLEPGFGRGLWFVLDGPNVAVETRINTTLKDWLNQFKVPSVYIYATYIMVNLIGLWVLTLAFIRSRGILIILSISTLLTFWITPYALQYDFPLLVIPFLLTIEGLEKHHLAKRIAIYLLIGLMGSVLFWERPISDGFWIVLFTSIIFILANNLKLNYHKAE